VVTVLEVCKAMLSIGWMRHGEDMGLCVVVGWFGCTVAALGVVGWCGVVCMSCKRVTKLYAGIMGWVWHGRQSCKRKLGSAAVAYRGVLVLVWVVMMGKERCAVV
jgi:hypothetical protein